MSSPYYQDDFVTLYHGDCREVLPALSVVDLVITDPPYQSLNVEVSRGTTTRLVRPDELSGKRLASRERGSWFETLDASQLAEIFSLCRERLAQTGALYVFADVKSGLVIFPPLKPANVLVWDKRQLGMGYSWRRMHEWIAYCPNPQHELRRRDLGDIVRASGVHEKQHATEKPCDVLRPLIENSSDAGGLVLDPFAGSGTTLVAAKGLGRKAIGIELEERYCEIAATRLSQHVLDFGGVA